MEQCKNCGKEIKWDQYDKHQGLCPECFRLEKYGIEGKTCFKCDKLAFEKCGNCGTPICKEHTIERYLPRIMRGSRQCEKCWKKTNVRVAIFTLIGAGLFIGLVWVAIWLDLR